MKKFLLTTIYTDKVLMGGNHSEIRPIAIECPTEDLALTFKRMLSRCDNIGKISIGKQAETPATMYVNDKATKVHRIIFNADGTITNPDNLNLEYLNELSIFLQMGRYYILWK